MLSELILKAAKNGDWMTVYVFLDAQIDYQNTTSSEKSIVNLNARGSDNLTLFDHAIAQKNPDAIRYLCYRGAKTSIELDNHSLPFIQPQPVYPRFNPYYEKTLKTLAPSLKFKPLIEKHEEKRISPLSLT